MAVTSQLSQGVAQVPFHSQSPLAQLPPSERDFQVFEEIAADGLSTREVAAKHHLSQTRIMQIHRKVALWMATMPTEPQMTSVEQIRVATEVAVMRIDKLYSEAMRAWTASQQPQAECRGIPGSEMRTLTSRYGDPRYLAMAARMAERQLQAAVIGSKAIAAVEAKHRAQGSNRGEGEAPAEPCAAEQAHPFTNPLNRACSESANSLDYRGQPHADELNPSACSDATCDEVETRRREFLNALANDTAPVQPPVTDAHGMQIEEVQSDPVETLLSKPAQPTAAPRRPLNRQERRRRERLLRRMKRKAK
jgi:hypothetical protein